MNPRRQDIDMDFAQETWGMIRKAINYVGRGSGGASSRNHAADFKIPKGCKLDNDA